MRCETTAAGSRWVRTGQGLEALCPIPVAIIFNDPAHWHAPDLPVMVILEPMPGTSVGMAGKRGDTVIDAATHIIRHYRPALDPTAEPWEWDTPWREILPCAAPCFSFSTDVPASRAVVITPLSRRPAR